MRLGSWTNLVLRVCDPFGRLLKRMTGSTNEIDHIGHNSGTKVSFQSEVKLIQTSIYFFDTFLSDYFRSRISLVILEVNLVYGLVFQSFQSQSLENS